MRPTCQTVSFTTVINRSFEHHAWDSTIWLCSTPILTDKNLENDQVSSPSTNYSIGVSLLYEYSESSLTTQALHIYIFPCHFRELIPRSTAQTSVA
ncbi:hypothetical protein TNCV_3899871 [Trichonephila clavipes]|nr:hypothetical protein TNCV_3899871 [Trichonephila clavipes]